MIECARCDNVITVLDSPSLFLAYCDSCFQSILNQNTELERKIKDLELDNSDLRLKGILSE